MDKTTLVLVMAGLLLIFIGLVAAYVWSARVKKAVPINSEAVVTFETMCAVINHASSKNHELNRAVDTIIERYCDVIEGERPFDVYIVLFGEYLGRSHYRRLVASLYSLEHSGHGHNGLAAAHVALHQPVHGPIGRHIIFYSADDPFLGRCQRIGYFVSERNFKRVGWFERNTLFLKNHSLLPDHEPEFQRKQFLETEPKVSVARSPVQDGEILLFCRKVDFRQSFGRGHERVFIDEEIGQCLVDGSGAGIENELYQDADRTDRQP